MSFRDTAGALRMRSGCAGVKNDLASASENWFGGIGTKPQGTSQGCENHRFLTHRVSHPIRSHGRCLVCPAESWAFCARHVPYLWRTQAV